MDTSVDIGRVLDRVVAQRNAAMDGEAKALAKVDELLAENTELRAELEQLRRGEPGRPVVPGSVEGVS